MFWYLNLTSNRITKLHKSYSLSTFWCFTLKNDKIDITIYSDSKYVVESIEKGWIWNWEKKNFKKKLNSDLWKIFIPLHKKFKIKFKWVKGHSGDVENERCDELANKAQEKELLIDKYYENNT